MSNNLDTLNAFYEAFNRRAIDEALRYVDPDIEVVPGVMAPDSETRYVGREGDGRIVRSEGFTDHREALEAAGLSE